MSLVGCTVCPGRYKMVWPLVITVSLQLLHASTANTGYFWHVTDFHYDFTYWNSKLSCNNNVTNPGEYGDYWCDSPWRLITDSIQAMKNIKPDVDFLLWTGDTVAHIKDAYMNVSLNMEILQNLTTALDNSFPDKIVYATFGNHDYYPTDQFPHFNDVIYNITANMWKKWIGDETQMDNFRKGGYYTGVTNTGLRIVCLNTNLYYTSNRVTVNESDPAGQIAWFRDVMQSARNASQKVLITAHIPPGVHTPDRVTWFYPKFNEPLHNIFRNFSDIIVGMHFGHDHHDGFKVFPDSENKAAVPMFVAPSVTPWRFKLPDGRVGPPHDPSVRLVYYDTTTGKHLDVVQFRLNLTDANAQSPLTSGGNFTQLYKFTEHYGVADISATSLNALIKRMSSGTEGNRLIQDYYRFTTAGAAQEGDEKTCNPTCAARILCGFTHHLLEEFDSCVKDYISTTSSSTFSSVTDYVSTISSSSFSSTSAFVVVTLAAMTLWTSA